MGLNDLDDFYRHPILDHCRNPLNQDTLEDPDISGQAVNPFCGDEVDLQLVLDSGRVSRVGIQGRGCSINRATASMLSEVLGGRTIEEIQTLADLFRSMMRGQEPFPEELYRMGDLPSLSGVRKSPVRIKCALLAWSALEQGIEDYVRSRQS